MSKSVLALATALLVAACGRPAATSSIAPSLLGPPEAFECVMKAFQALGYQRTMYDQDEMRTTARKENPKITFSNTQFRKTWDRLDVTVHTGTAGTEIALVTATEAEYFSQNGKNLEPLTPSPDVQQAAQELRARCGGSEATPRDSVPSAKHPRDSVPSAKQ